MGSQRAPIILPQELVHEIDALVGPRGRSAFLVETAKAELRKRWLLEFLRDPEPAWKDEDHPELANGCEASGKRARLACVVLKTAKRSSVDRPFGYNLADRCSARAARTHWPDTDNGGNRLPSGYFGDQRR